MADSTTNLDTIAVGQAGKEETANENFDAASPATDFGRHASACSGLTWAYYGGLAPVVDVPTRFDNGTLTLTNTATCYIYLDASGMADSPPVPVAFVTSAPANWPAPNGDDIPLYTATTAGGAVTSYSDHRCWLRKVSLNLRADSYQLTAAAIVTDAGTTKTLAASDNGKVIYFTSASAVTLNMAASLGAGFSCALIQGGAGQITFAANAQTMTVVGGFTKTDSAGAMATIIAPVANTFFISGALA